MYQIYYLRNINMNEPLVDHKNVMTTFHYLGLYRTFRPVRKSGEFWKSGLLRNRTFSFKDARLLKLHSQIFSTFKF